jgi:DnaK suppressor protein
MATSKSTKSAKAATKAVTASKPVKPVKEIVKQTSRLAILAKSAAVVRVRKTAAASSVANKPEATEGAASKALHKSLRFSDKDLENFRKELLAMRDRLTGQVARMRQDSLKRDDEVNPEEDGTDAFDRLFALERAGSDQDRIFTIDEAIRAIDEGKYGICEECDNLIEKPRLHALPFAKNCIKCQSAVEHGRNNGGSRRQAP